MDDVKIIGIAGVSNCEFSTTEKINVIKYELPLGIIQDAEALISYRFLFGIGSFSKVLTEPFHILTAFSKDYILKATPNLDDEDFEELKFTALPIVFKSFLSSLWLIKDNAVSIPSLYCVKEVNGKAEKGEILHLEMHTDAKGETPKTLFTLDDFNRAVEVGRELNKICDGHLKNLMLETAGFHSFIELENRVLRSFMGINAARTLFFLPAKIAMYILSLECLFSEGAEEGITHKIAERVAFYLEEKNKERKDIYDVVSSAYKVRSRYFHGNNPNSTKKSLQHQHEQRQNLSEKMDNILRRIFIRIIEKDSKLFLRPIDKSNSVSEKETFGYFLKSLVLPE